MIKSLRSLKSVNATFDNLDDRIKISWERLCRLSSVFYSLRLVHLAMEKELSSIFSKGKALVRWIASGVLS